MLSSALRCFLLQRMGLHNSLTVVVTSFWVYMATLFPYLDLAYASAACITAAVVVQILTARAAVTTVTSLTLLAQKHNPGLYF